MDRIRWYYYFKKGFSLETELSLPNFSEVMAYWKPFEVDAVYRITSEFPNSIIDFGAGHSWYPDPEHFVQVEKALNPFPNIFLLLPSPDKEESIQICNQRLLERRGKPLEETEIKANRDFVEHESNYRLAKHILYTKNKTPEDTAAEIFKLLK